MDAVTLALMQYSASSGGGTTQETVTGNAPITLSDASAKPIVSLTQTGLCSQRNLPSGFTQLSYVAGDGSSGYVNTGIVLNSTDLDVSVDVQFASTTSSSPKMAWGFMGAISNLPRWGFGLYQSKWLGTPNTTAQVGTADTDRHTAVMRIYDDNGTAKYSGTLDGASLYSATSVESVSLLRGNTLPLYLFARNNDSTAGNFGDCKVYGFKVWKAGVLTHDLVPCKTSSAVGFYDVVTGTFLAGTGTLTAGSDAVPSPSAPMDIYCNNGALKYGQYGKNLNVGTLAGVGYTSTGSESTSDTFVGTLWKIPCSEGEKYTVSYGGFTTSGITGVFVNTWKTDGTFNTRQAIASTGVTTYTIPAGVGKVNFTLYKTGGATIDDGAWMQVERGETATSYEPAHFGWHTDGTAEVLWIDDGNKFPPNAVADVKYPVSGSGSCVASCDVNNGSNVLAVEVHYYKADGTQINYYTLSSYDDTTHRMYKSFSLPNTAAYVSIERKAAYLTATVTDLKLAMGSTLTPYVQPTGDASAQNLLAVGSYADTQEIISGAITRKCGIKVFDGTETWTLASNNDASGNKCFYTPFTDRAGGTISLTLLCTHYAQAPAASYTTLTTGQFLYNSNASNLNVYFDGGAITTKDGWTGWLKAQYDAGTPVIVVYPLAEETTESVAGQSLSTAAGTNVVSVMAEVSPVALEAVYKSGSGSGSSGIWLLQYLLRTSQRKIRP